MAKTLLLQAGHRGAAGGALQPILIPDHNHEDQHDDDQHDDDQHDDDGQYDGQGDNIAIMMMNMTL